PALAPPRSPSPFPTPSPPSTNSSHAATDRSVFVGNAALFAPLLSVNSITLIAEKTGAAEANHQPRPPWRPTRYVWVNWIAYPKLRQTKSILSAPHHCPPHLARL